MSETLERILEEVKHLSADERQRLRELLAPAPLGEHPSRDPEFIRAACGSFAHLPTSSEDFIRRKQEEIDWEERRYRSE